MNHGLTSEEAGTFTELVLKANAEQVKAMLSTLQGELKKRELLAGGFKYQPPALRLDLSKVTR